MGSNPNRECEKVASDLGLCGDFRRVLWFSAKSYNWLVTTSPQYGRKGEEKRNSKFEKGLMVSSAIFAL